MQKKIKRNAKIINMRAKGKTYDFIALNFGLSKQRIRQICKHKEDQWNLEEKGFKGLTTRTALALLRSGVINKNDLNEKLINGFFVRGIGEKGIQEIEKLVKKKIITTYDYKKIGNGFESISKFLKYRED